MRDGGLRVQGTVGSSKPVWEMLVTKLIGEVWGTGKTEVAFICSWCRCEASFLKIVLLIFKMSSVKRQLTHDSKSSVLIPGKRQKLLS